MMSDAEQFASDQCAAEEAAADRHIQQENARCDVEGSARWYVLTDGGETGRRRQMTPDEAAQANREAERATDGNWWWALDDRDAAPDHAPGCDCAYCSEDYADVEDSSAFVSSMREAVEYWGEP